ncbi:hypothetical protein BDR06DRAFT_116572 [Suillus hirtellus]|nr:hypothetical protein BDR06DRAFT_116572 [Suillus hirtellus]
MFTQLHIAFQTFSIIVNDQYMGVYLRTGSIHLSPNLQCLSSAFILLVCILCCQMLLHCVKPRLHPAKFSIPCTTTSSPNHGMSETSFRLRQAPLTPRQVLPNIFAVSVLISTSTLYAASRPTTVPRQI